jgi:D-alanyl-D-alanine carboxypeptidase/D-alanyl-D-alanine-endopeptidase (penicillin-binding protein 4)
MRFLAVLLLALLGGAPVHAQTQGLARDLRDLVRGPGTHAVLVVSLDRGDTLFSWNADERLTPASNLKLFSTAAALHYLGPEFRWSTYLLSGGDLRGGVLAGDLVLFGTGDPTLGSARFPGTARALDALADSLRALGVREVAGSVVADGSFFDPRLRAEGWTREDLASWYGAPVSAVVTAENLSGGRPVDEPLRVAADRFRAALARAGIAVRGGVRTVREPSLSLAGFHARRPGTGARVLATHRSPALREVVRVTNHVSHNLFADEALKTVGRVAIGEGSFGAGERAVARMLPDADPPRMLDGSGLSRLDRASARTVVALLAAMARSPESAAFRESLPVAGSRTGLRRMWNTEAAGNLRAKTGTLATVSSLSGYVTAANGERLAFAIIANAVRPAAAKETENRIGARLARFRR